jgi:hypothetical protein
VATTALQFERRTYEIRSLRLSPCLGGIGIFHFSGLFENGAENRHPKY